MKHSLLVIGLLISSFVYAQHSHAKKGTNGGYLVEVGKGIAQLEVIHDSRTGVMTIIVLDKNAKAMDVEKAPRINLNTFKGRKQVRSVAVQADNDGKAFTFKATSPLLKGSLRGAISIKINDKTYTTSLPHAH